MAAVHILVQLVNNLGFQVRCIYSFKWLVATSHAHKNSIRGEVLWAQSLCLGKETLTSDSYQEGQHQFCLRVIPLVNLLCSCRKISEIRNWT